MHRSRLPLLAIVAAAACSRRTENDGADLLSRDPSLAAGLNDNHTARQLPLPDVCASMAPIARPTVASERQAQELTRQAYSAELVGNADSARSLLSRAAKLDATDRSAAYHLGRANEALGDRAGATTAYCRFIALTPATSESAEARQRLVALTQAENRVSAASVGYVAPAARRATRTTARRVSRARSAAPMQVAGGIVEQSSRRAPLERAATRERARSSRSPSDGGTHSASSAGAMADDTSAPTDGTSSSPSAVQPPTQAPTVRRGPGRMQSAGIGAIAGAIMGAAAGRSVKSAVMGAAAGGVLGAAVGGATSRPGSTFVGRQMQPITPAADPRAPSSATRSESLPAHRPSVASAGGR